MEEITDLRKAFLRAVEQDAIGGVTLKDAVGPEDEVTIVVSDITRSWMHQDRSCPFWLSIFTTASAFPMRRQSS